MPDVTFLERVTGENDGTRISCIFLLLPVGFPPQKLEKLEKTVTDTRTFNSLRFLPRMFLIISKGPLPDLRLSTC
jgi:hypothetical protein